MPTTMAVVNSGGRTLALLALLGPLTLLGTSNAAFAAGFDLDFFKPAAASTGYLSEESARVLPAGGMDVGIAFGYSRQPLVRRDQFTGQGGGDIVNDRFTGFFNAAFGIADRVDLGVRVPAVLQQTGDVDVDISEGGGILQRPRARAFGDVELLTRLRMVGGPEASGFHLTLTAPFGIPTGAPDGLTGNGTVSFRPRVIAGWEAHRLSAAASVGYEFRRSAEVPSSNLVVGNALAAGAGIAYAVIPWKIWILGEASASVGVSQSESGVSAIPAQAMLGGRVVLTDRVIIQAGAGTGLNHAPGSSRFRALFTVTYVGSPAGPHGH